MGINRGDIDSIEAIKGNVDWHCLFHVEKVERGVRLKTDNSKYISRINRGPEYEPMEAAKKRSRLPLRFRGGPV